MLHCPNISLPCSSFPGADELAMDFRVALDPFQTHAIAAIHAGENVLVTAKTGSGKTLVAEYAIAYALRAGQRVFYTTPIKSLSNQKYHDLKQLFPAVSVGILTGDIKSNPDAQIVVMTTEILRNLLFKQATATANLGVAGVVSMEGLGLVVFDEVHYINDPDRGHVWEESLILVPPHIRLVMLSATIDAPEAFAGWLGGLKQVPCCLLSTTYRVVPLVHAVYTPGLKEPTPLGVVLKDRDEAPFAAEAYRGWLRDRSAAAKAADDWKLTVQNAKRAGESAGGLKGKVKPVGFQHQLNECIDTLRTRDLLPALVFSFSRRECERFADRTTGSLITSSEAADVQHIIDFHLHRHAVVLEKLPQYHQIVGLLRRGVAFHHSGLLPLLKEIVELLFLRGLVKVLFATESLAIGLNMPARTVVFTGLEKPAADSHGGFVMRPLRHDEYTQMAGRAGRRGKDTRGYVFYLPFREPADVEDMRQALSGSLVPLQSRIQFHYDFVLKAVHLSGSSSDSGSVGSANSSGESLTERLVTDSYWSVQRQEALQKAEAALITAKAHEESVAAKLTADQQAAFQLRDTLEHQVRALTNAKQKAAKLALKRWQEEHVGPLWTSAAKTWVTLCDTRRCLQEAQEAVVTLTSVKIADRLQPVLAALTEWEFLTPSGTLTPLGVLATEVNEGNPILMTKLYESGLLANDTAIDVVATLAAFVPKERVEETAASLDWPDHLAAGFLGRQAKQGEAVDARAGVTSPADFWDIDPFWPTVTKAWLEGADAGWLAQTYGLFEGNLMRGLLKVANLVNEWTSMATFKGDVGMLDKLRDIPTLLLRDIAQPESLYLRL